MPIHLIFDLAAAACALTVTLGVYVIIGDGTYWTMTFPRSPAHFLRGSELPVARPDNGRTVRYAIHVKCVWKRIGDPLSEGSVLSV